VSVRLSVTGTDSLLSVVDRRRHGDSVTIDSSPVSSDISSDLNLSPLSTTDHLGMSTLRLALCTSVCLSVCLSR